MPSPATDKAWIPAFAGMTMGMAAGMTMRMAAGMTAVADGNEGWDAGNPGEGASPLALSQRERVG